MPYMLEFSRSSEAVNTVSGPFNTTGLTYSGVPAPKGRLSARSRELQCE